MTPGRSIVMTLGLSVLLAGLGAWSGATYVMRTMHAETPLHELVHEKLDLSPEQKRRIEGLEQTQAGQQQALQAEMRAANADLSRAIASSHAYTPEVQAAVDRFHHAMGELQKQTILHVLAMRAELTPQQAQLFDQTVTRSLTEAGK
jgi:Spy/CpxP family protein refolding chaperone